MVRTVYERAADDDDLYADDAETVLINDVQARLSVSFNEFDFQGKHYAGLFT